MSANIDYSTDIKPKSFQKLHTPYERLWFFPKLIFGYDEQHKHCHWAQLFRAEQWLKNRNQSKSHQDHLVRQI